MKSEKKAEKKAEAEVQMDTQVDTQVVAPQVPQPIDIDTFEIKTLEDFDIYNRQARKLKRPVKVPDESFHKKVRVKFQRFDQPENVLKCWVRNKDIDWKGQLKPGKVYDLPVPVVRFLNRLAEPIYAEVKVDDGGETKTETRQVGERNRFSCQQLEFV